MSSNSLNIIKLGIDQNSINKWSEIVLNLDHLIPMEGQRFKINNIQISAPYARIQEVKSFYTHMEKVSTNGKVLKSSSSTAKI
mmetsp:Transcript_5224/g.4809  ORF Transcript_5224/g.4809 Transcript_5224/m.4809 type:complete len:83 (+) Transcript_5224:709-957(+)